LINSFHAGISLKALLLKVLDTAALLDQPILPTWEISLPASTSAFANSDLSGLWVTQVDIIEPSTGRY
jgi:hypothetical protein